MVSVLTVSVLTVSVLAVPNVRLTFNPRSLLGRIFCSPCADGFCVDISVSTFSVLANISDDRKKRHTWRYKMFRTKLKYPKNTACIIQLPLLFWSHPQCCWRAWNFPVPLYQEAPPGFGNLDGQLGNSDSSRRAELPTIFMNVKVFPQLNSLQFRTNHVMPCRYAL